MPFTLLETPTEWIAEREVDSEFLDLKERETSVGSVRYERGIKGGNTVLRRIFYPKRYFPTEETVLSILSTLENTCPLCKGSNTSNATYLSSKQRGEVGNMPEDDGSSIFKVLDHVTGGAEASRAVGTELLALAIQEPLNMFTTTLGEKIADFIIGLGLTAAVAAPIGHRSRMDALQMGMHFFNQLIDPRDYEVTALQNDINKLQSAMSLGNANSVLNALIKIPTIPGVPALSVPSVPVPNIQLPSLIPGLPQVTLAIPSLPAGLNLPNLSLSGTGTVSVPTPAPVVAGNIVPGVSPAPISVVPPQIVQLGGGVTPIGEVDVTQFKNPARVAIY